MILAGGGNCGTNIDDDDGDDDDDDDSCNVISEFYAIHNEESR